MKKLIKKLLKEQILNGSCATSTYLYPNPGTAYENINHISTTYGITAHFSEYYQTHPTTNHPNCCRDENNDCLGKWTFISSSSSPSKGGIYIGGVNMAATWKQFIDQVNAVHQANNIPELASYNWTFVDGAGNQPHALTQPGIINTDFFRINGGTCMGCPDPVQPPIYGCIDQTAINYDPNATTDDGSCEYHYNCVDGECVKDANGSYSSVMECQKSPCGTPVSNDVKTVDTKVDDENVSGNCSVNPTGECWVCHHDVNSNQPPSSCVQLSNLPSGWVTSTGIPQGFNYYNTESDCMAAGPDCINSQENITRAAETKSINEDIKRMKGLINY